MVLRILCAASLVAAPLTAQTPITAASAEEVQFSAADGVRIHADLHRSSAGLRGPIILLFHQAGSNARGEYRDIVPRLVANGFSILAVDLRLGGSLHGGINRTMRAGDLPDSREYCTAYPDLVAAWQFVLRQGFSGPRFVWGSSYSAALALQLASTQGEEMSGVLAFSPASGEPMEGCRPERYLPRLSIPALILRPAAEAEIPSVVAQIEQFHAAGKQVYIARPGTHGSSMLSAERVESGTEDTWAVVLDFLRSHSLPPSDPAVSGRTRHAGPPTLRGIALRIQAVSRSQQCPSTPARPSCSQP